MKLGKFGKSLAVGSFAVAMLAGAQTVTAQNTTREYRDWQQAQRQAQQEQRVYQRTRSARDYRDWQQAQRRAQQEYAEYQRSLQRGNTYGRTVYGNVNTGRQAGFYRINRGGTYYNVDQRQYQLLQNAVNQGYQQGFNAGTRDRGYNRNESYYSNDSVYRSGTYGYQSYVARDQYQYYFQQGFQRGYQDGINSRYQYGYRTNNGLSILGNVLGSILQLVD
ncbi:MAG: hypothetical protein ABIR33_04030 [Pyrinomonadaceae bacterium]